MFMYVCVLQVQGRLRNEFGTEHTSLADPWSGAPVCDSHFYTTNYPMRTMLGGLHFVRLFVKLTVHDLFGQLITLMVSIHKTRLILLRFST